jgi:hypothetical protein
MTSFFSSSTTNATPYAFDKVIQILLRAYPEAAQIPQGKSGRLPLVLAIRAGHRQWEDGIQTLVGAYPPALHSAKVGKAYPEALALVGGGGHPPCRAKSILENMEGGLRIFQNLCLLAQHRKEPGSPACRRRNRQDKTTTAHDHKQREQPSKHRNLTNLFHLLKAKPELVDKERYGSCES